jgi:DNA-binding response OmpR family regulator
MLFGKRARTINRLLIVEDEPLIAFDNEHFLRDKGFEVVATVDTVADALASIAAQPIDLVLADVNLSDGNGIEGIKQIALRVRLG